MFIYTPESLILIEQERRQNLLRAAEQTRLVRLAQADRPALWTRLQAVVQAVAAIRPRRAAACCAPACCAPA